MAKNTQSFVLFNMLKAAGSKGVTKTEVAKALGVKESSVAIYFFGLKKFFKAEIETVKKGRQIVSYKLANADDIEVPSHRKGANSVVKSTSKKASKVVRTKHVKATKTATVDVDTGEVAVPDSDLHVTKITDREFSDIKSSLGL